MSTISSDRGQQFPSKTYHKYKSQCKTNPMFNKLNNDSGYPQQILYTNYYPTSKKKNYLNLNKQNLKNFFQERLPKKQPAFQKQVKTIDPSKIFQIKRRQYQLKNQTKINLQKTIDIDTQSNSIQIQKIKQNFYINDKNKDFRKKFKQSQNRTIQPYHSQNFRKGTKSFTNKYSKVLKKQAYDKVFGPDISAVSGRSVKKQINSAQIKSARQRIKISNKKQQTQINSTRQRKKRFSSLLSKLDSYRKDFDPDNKAGISDYFPEQDENENQHQSNMITWIQDATKFYRGQLMQNNIQKLQNLDDIQKLDNNYYKQMNDHKKSRQRTRQYMIHKQKLQDSSLYNSNMSKVYQKQMSQLPSLSRQSQSIYQVKQEQQPYLYFKPKSLLTVKQRFQRFGNQLTRNYFKGKFYQIKNIFNIANAFFKKPQPYQIEGSYAFFTSIKNGDIIGMQYFLGQNPGYLYEIDHKGRSPLIYATINLRRQVVLFLLDMDVNVDHKCYKNKTALYHALKNQNMELVRDLLLAGASPWSSQQAPYKDFYKNSKNRKIKILMKNAKKISLAISLKHPKKVKLQYWLQNKHRIDQDQVIAFR